ncbi:CDF family Co(II)/Ni(II) efflux transporter DmeF [Rhizobium straminoryzae]|nr:CDF family Co(II)/Ni(II) efflux transporter DmeF [Rhizobium straminoryzae]
MTTHVHGNPDAAASPMGHEHVFLGRHHDRNARKVGFVIALTAAMMIGEIVAGSLFGSMALLADGWHMSTHAGAMLIAAVAYWYARREARNGRFTFGTGKLGDLAGFASAIVLALIALLIAVESLMRLAEPVPIAFGDAIFVALLGLGVNLVSAWLLRDEPHHHGHDHHHEHGHSHRTGRHVAHDHPHHGHPEAGHHDHDHHHEHHGHAAHTAHRGSHHGHAGDNNLRAAYVHVLADALTSVLAILALLLGRAYGWIWLDPVMGIVGGLVIARWSWALIRDTARVLLDVVPEEGRLAEEIRKRLSTSEGQVTDLHVWQVGPGHHAAIVALSASEPLEPAAYKDRLKDLDTLSHVTVEVSRAA